MGLGPSTKRFEMVAPQEWIRRVDDWRRNQSELPSRAEAIRRLVDIGLSANDVAPAKQPRIGGLEQALAEFFAENPGRFHDLGFDQPIAAGEAAKAVLANDLRLNVHQAIQLFEMVSDSPGDTPIKRRLSQLLDTLMRLAGARTPSEMEDAR